MEETSSELGTLLVKLELKSESDKQRFRALYTSVLGPSEGGSFPPLEDPDPDLTTFRSLFRNHFRRNPFVIIRRDKLRLACDDAEADYTRMSSSSISTTTLAAALPAELQKERDWIVKVNEMRRETFLDSSIAGAVDHFKTQLASKYPPQKLRYYEEPELRDFCTDLMERVGDLFSQSIEWLEGEEEAHKLAEELLTTKLSLVVNEALEENERSADLTGKFISAILQYKTQMTKFFAETSPEEADSETVNRAHLRAKSECEKEPAIAQLLLTNNPVNKLAWESRIAEECSSLKQNYYGTTKRDVRLMVLQSLRDKICKTPAAPCKKAVEVDQQRYTPNNLVITAAISQYKKQMSSFLQQNPFVSKDKVEGFHLQTKRECEEEEPTGLASLLLRDPNAKFPWESKISEEYSHLERDWIAQKYNLVESLQEELKAHCVQIIKARYNVRLDVSECEDIFASRFPFNMKHILEENAEAGASLVETGKTTIPDDVRGSDSERLGKKGSSAKEEEVRTTTASNQRTTMADICVIYETAQSPYFNSELIFPQGTAFPSPPEFRVIPAGPPPPPTNNNNSASPYSLNVQFLEVEGSAGSIMTTTAGLDHSRFRGAQQGVGYNRDKEVGLQLTCYIDSSGVFRANMLNPISGQVITCEHKVIGGIMTPAHGRVLDDDGDTPSSAKRRKVGRGMQ